MTEKELLDDIIRGIPVESIPLQFISMVKLTEEGGDVYILQGDDMLHFFLYPSHYGRVEATVVVKTRILHKMILNQTSELYAEVSRRQQARFQ